MIQTRLQLQVNRYTKAIVQVSEEPNQYKASSLTQLNTYAQFTKVQVKTRQALKQSWPEQKYTRKPELQSKPVPSSNNIKNQVAV